MGIFEKIFSEVRHGTLVQTPCTPVVGSVLFVGLAICIGSVVIRQYLKVVKHTSEFVSTGIFISFARQMVL